MFAEGVRGLLFSFLRFGDLFCWCCIVSNFPGFQVRARFRGDFGEGCVDSLFAIYGFDLRDCYRTGIQGIRVPEGLAGRSWLELRGVWVWRGFEGGLCFF